MTSMKNSVFLPAIPSAELVGRMVENAFGVKEAVCIPRATWDFYDWCQENGMDMVEWVRKLDEVRSPEISFNDYLWVCLWSLHCSRLKQGLPCPPNSEPEGYSDFLAAVERGEIKEMT